MCSPFPGHVGKIEYCSKATEVEFDVIVDELAPRMRLEGICRSQEAVLTGNPRYGVSL